MDGEDNGSEAACSRRSPGLDLASVSAHPESASQFSAKYWDMLSEWGVLRKLHPRILPWNGMRFRTGVQKETASRFDVGTANKSRTVIWRGLEFA